MSTARVPRTMLAIVQDLKQGPFRIGKVPVPVPKSSELLIRVNSCALNPVDWKQLKLGVLTFSFPLIVGCDVAGVVVGKGPTCTDKFHVGDEVIAYTRNGHNGAFAEFVVCREGVVARKPPHLAPHVAASIPLGLVTAAVALYLPVSHNLPWPDPNSNNDGAYILIWGASSSCGSWAVQLAAMSGMKVIGVAGPSNLEYVKSLGALHVLDRSKPAAAIEEVRRIVRASSTRLLLAADAIGSETASYCVDALDEGGKVSCISGTPTKTRKGVDAIPVNAGWIHGSRYASFGERFWQHVEPLLFSGALRPCPPVTLLPGGLRGVMDGIARMSKGEVSASKLVAILDETKEKDIGVFANL